MAKGVSKGQQLIRVKAVDSNGKWYTVTTHFNWDSACDSYNSIAAPKMMTTKTKVIHKQFKNNGFIFNQGTDPRTFTV